jgi:hypothetical protein
MIVGQLNKIFHHESEKLTPGSTVETGELRETERVAPDPLEEDKEIDLLVLSCFKSLNMILPIFRKI